MVRKENRGLKHLQIGRDGGFEESEGSYKIGSDLGRGLCPRARRDLAELR